MIGAAVYKTIEGRVLQADIQELTVSLGRAFLRAGAHQVQYRVAEPGEGADPYLDILAPSAVVHLSVGSLGLHKKPKAGRIVLKDDRGKQISGDAWEYRADLPVRVRVTRHPGGEALLEFSETVVYAQEFFKERDIREWYREIEQGLFSNIVKHLGRSFTVQRVVRRRPLFQVETNQGWRYHWNLAVSAEMSRDYDSARSRYELARREAREDPDAGKIHWDGVLEDVRRAWQAHGDRPVGPPAWFQPRVAVLPFSDETTSVDGPEKIRITVWDRLRAGGYSVMALEEVDAILREHGFSQGGQLKLAQPRELARWLGAQRLVFGHIAMYQTVPWRVVSGKLQMWDAGEEKTVWAAQETATQETLSRGRLRGRYGSGDVWRQLRWSPLAAEADFFARQGLESLPMSLAGEGSSP